MSDQHIAQVRALLLQCNAEEREEIFRDLRKSHHIHVFEQVIGAPAEMILEAVHRAPELTRRMLRGVIADAAFASFVVPQLGEKWRDTTPSGNFAYDYQLTDEIGNVTVQVKLQRSEKGAPVVKPGERYGFDSSVFMTETQKTRGGTDSEENQTRPYRYGEFDILAVSMQPSTNLWNQYMYTVGRWLIEGKKPGEMATMQPVAMKSNEFWTDNFNIAAAWHRSDSGDKRMTVTKAAAKSRRSPRKKNPVS